MSFEAPINVPMTSGPLPIDYLRQTFQDRWKELTPSLHIEGLDLIFTPVQTADGNSVAQWCAWTARGFVLAQKYEQMEDE